MEQEFNMPEDLLGKIMSNRHQWKERLAKELDNQFSTRLGRTASATKVQYYVQESQALIGFIDLDMEDKQMFPVLRIDNFGTERMCLTALGGINDVPCFELGSVIQQIFNWYEDLYVPTTQTYSEDFVNQLEIWGRMLAVSTMILDYESMFITHYYEEQEEPTLQHIFLEHEFDWEFQQCTFSLSGEESIPIGTLSSCTNSKEGIFFFLSNTSTYIEAVLENILRWESISII